MFLSFIPYVIVFIGSLYGNQDPDLGWHLKYGEYFVQHGNILKENTFSTLMPNFNWANGSWGTDVITYLIFHFGGFLGLTLFSSFIVVLTFYFVAKAAKFTILDQLFLFPLLLYLVQIANLFPFKGQQFSMLFIVILFWLTNLYKIRSENTKRKHINPLLFSIPLFLIWANIHEEFFLGLGLFLMWILTYFGQRFIVAYGGSLKSFFNSKNNQEFEFIRKLSSYLKNDRNEIIKVIVIFVLCFAATLINPFGIRVHIDALSYVGNPLLQHISEYAPLSAISQLLWSHIFFGILLAISLSISYFTKNKISLNIPILIIVVLLYIISFFVMRYAWPMYYLGIILLKPLIDLININKKKYLLILETIGLFLLLAIVVILKQPFSRYTQFSWSDYYYCWNLCSPNSAEFLIQNHLTKNIFSDYNWGGWLIWNYPTIKPVVDGRMHLWRDKNGYSGFADYLAYKENRKDINTSSYNTVYISPDTPIYEYLSSSSNKGKWLLLYKDAEAAIFMRNTAAQWKIFANPSVYGKYLLQIGKTNNAKQQLTLSINQNPNQWEPYHLLAIIYEKEKNYTKAKSLEIQAIKNHPTNSDLYDNLAKMIYLSEPPEDTINFTSEILKKYPTDWKLNALTALAYYQRDGNTQTALNYAQKAYSINPIQVTYDILKKITNGESVENLVQ